MKLVFSKRHPCIEGHFPGDPVVPAVSILSELMAWAESETGRRVTGVKSARFRSALHPEVCWTAEMEEHSDETLGITCSDQSRVTMSAKLIIERP